ncbi:uncharacterized protein V1516DRAFT_40717 [Lipomyces oligophaga]|uniref:uncharacterized protein n=1 Tax=Lipomyces oligophaga TaxID=45792 RepID=UPI0034CEF243
MPLDIAFSAVFDGTELAPYWPYIKTYGPYVGATYLAKRFFGGARNSWEREMHGRVVMITGGTSGVGAAVAEELARRGAQLIFLVRSISDSWLVESIADLRERTGNQLIYAEEVDLGSLYSVRKFATRWLDNTPPRRLDTIVCCANVMQPPFKQKVLTSDGVESQWAVNYLGHYHLLTLLAPAFRAQPADRDVRIILANCSTYVLGDLDLDDLEWKTRQYPSIRPWRVFATSKLALYLFAREFQRSFDTYKRPDGLPSHNIHVMLANPGFVRTSSSRNFISLGSIWGLLLYLIMWPFWWLILKSSNQGAQTLLHALSCPDGAIGEGVKVYNECAELKTQSPLKIANDDEVAAELFARTKKQIEVVERAAALLRNQDKESRESTEPDNSKESFAKAGTKKAANKANSDKSRKRKQTKKT